MNKYVRMIIVTLIIQFIIGAFIVYESNSLLIKILGAIIIITTPLIAEYIRRNLKEGEADTIHLRDMSRSLSDKNWELARLNEQLRIASERKTEFISIASHQLRTPLTVITGYLSMIIEKSYGDVPKDLSVPIERAHKSAVRLTNLVNELLRISKIEQGDIHYEIVSIDAITIVNEIMDEFRKFATDKGLELTLEVVQSKIPYIVFADKDKLGEVLRNLIDNAIKYTPKGTVTIKISHGENNTDVISIIDTGIGVAHEDIRMLFSKFARGERGAKEFIDGTGLGLYISKKLICGMRGKIWIDSEGVGKGAIFSIALPIEQIKGPKAICDI